jgi:hypothetical protein
MGESGVVAPEGRLQSHMINEYEGMLILHFFIHMKLSCAL